MPERSRASERVQLLDRDPGLIAARDDLGGEGLVDFDDVDVLELRRIACSDRPSAHDSGGDVDLVALTIKVAVGRNVNRHDLGVKWPLSRASTALL
jgi:hypothetical protein